MKTKQQLKLKNRLRVYRAERRISQRELADDVGVTRATINAIEGEDYNPSLELAFRIARYFGAPLESIFSAHEGEQGEQV